jgi:hypothetical protein
VGGNVLGDADDRPDTRVDRLVDGVGGERAGDEDERGVRPSFLDRLRDGVEDGYALDVLTPLPRCHSGDEVRAVVAVAQAVEAALAAGESLDDEARVEVDDDRHYLRPLRTMRSRRT